MQRQSQYIKLSELLELTGYLLPGKNNNQPLSEDSLNYF